MTGTGAVAAVDLGATSGRVMLARVGPGRIAMRQVARFANDPLPLWNGAREALHWDLPGLYRQVGRGLAEAARLAPDLLGAGIDSWAVDYGLLRDGRLLGLPYHYRDGRTADGVAAVHATVARADLYGRNGLQFLPFTTVYQLAAERLAGTLDFADSALLVPDLLGYWLTGAKATERTNASTTGLLGIDGGWDEDLRARLGLPDLFPALADPGTPLGPVLPGVASAFGLDRKLTLSTVASHDTASAVAAVPMAPESAAYISCGTWGLVGVELPAPLVDPASRAANFTNEAGLDGRTRFLRNVMGLWLLSESVRHWQREGAAADLARLLAAAADSPAPAAVFDVDDPVFLAPGDIPGRIADWYAARDLPVPEGPVPMVRAIVESLAAAFATGVRTAAELTGVPVRTIHLVGGGARNLLLCRLLADHSGVPVLAGPVEATSLGNILVQARTHGLLHGDVDALRAEVATAFPPQRHVPGTEPVRKAS
ncbi:rhamnulokinase [Nocardia abscessus]|uniref:rhamnulokinase n=1 Tax=Nocardia abscessus TaxID=120957 RepID=UPI0002EBA8DF|nr:rhamnulokinase family protein [Nocardia abscessus]MCC3331238.1 rhamnulokinase [Nocardia abscessus]